MQPAERILRSELCASAKAEWVKEKLHTLQQGAGATQSWNDRQKAEQLLGALLFSDLNIIGAPALPANVKVCCGAHCPHLPHGLSPVVLSTGRFLNVGYAQGGLDWEICAAS